MTYSLEQIRKGIDHYASQPPPVNLSAGMKGAIRGVLLEVCESKKARDLVLMWLFPWRFRTLDEVTTKRLSTSEWFGLLRWLGVHKDEESKKWLPRDGVAEEVAEIWMAQAVKTGEAVVTDLSSV